VKDYRIRLMNPRRESILRQRKKEGLKEIHRKLRKPSKRRRIASRNRITSPQNNLKQSQLLLHSKMFNKRVVTKLRNRSSKKNNKRISRIIKAMEIIQRIKVDINSELALKENAMRNSSINERSPSK
jgi:hypothetical protein